MGNIRILAENAVLVLFKDGKPSEKSFEYGCLYPAILIERTADYNYCNIHFPDDYVAPGIAYAAFDNYGVPIKELTNE